jgi:hypothetical protein
VYFLDGKKRLRHLATSWTDAADPDLFVTIAAGRSHFRIDDLLELAALVATVRTQKKGQRHL